MLECPMCKRSVNTHETRGGRTVISEHRTEEGGSIWCDASNLSAVFVSVGTKALVSEMLELRKKVRESQHKLSASLQASFDEVFDNIEVFEARVNELLLGGGK